jgi:hypothetical protein
MGPEIIHDHVQLALRINGHRFVHEGQKIPALAALEMPGLHFPSGHLPGGKQRESAVLLVLRTEIRRGPCRQAAAATPVPAPGPELRLLIRTQHYGVFWRMQVKSHEVGRLASKLRVGGNAPGTPSLQADPVSPQDCPHPVRRHPQGLGYSNRLFELA